MNEISSQGVQKRIDFLGRWALAFFAVFILLAGWLGGRYEAGKFGILFDLGVVSVVAVVVIGIGLTWFTHKRIRRLEEHKDD